MRFAYSLLLLLLCSWAHGQVYTPQDADSKVTFTIKNFGSTVKGNFKGLTGTINFDATDVSRAAFDVTLQAATINTGIGIRDSHLRKSDYFGVNDFPTIRFVSTHVRKSDKPNEGRLTGKLTIRKTTQEISFPFRYSERNGAFQFTAEFTINRRDFGVGGNSLSLADDVMVMLDVSTTPYSP